MFRSILGFASVVIAASAFAHHSYTEFDDQRTVEIERRVGSLHRRELEIDDSPVPHVPAHPDQQVFGRRGVVLLDGRPVRRRSRPASAHERDGGNRRNGCALWARFEGQEEDGDGNRQKLVTHACTLVVDVNEKC